MRACCRGSAGWRLAAAVTLQVQRRKRGKGGSRENSFCMLIARCGSDAGSFLVDDGLGLKERRRLIDGRGHVELG